MTDLPKLYFRVRDNGAMVFRMQTANQTMRLSMDQIATVNLRRGDVTTTEGASLSTAEEAEIQDWIARRRVILDLRQLDDVARLVDQLNLITHWAQTRAGADALDAVADDLLLAMHDLRSALVRRKADALYKKG